MNAIYPGSFDPFTIGHYDIASRASVLFETLYIAVGFNISKRSFMDIDRRVELIKKCFSDNPKVKVISYDALTIELCKTLGINILVHGLRNATDLEYENQIAEVNRVLIPEVENIYLIGKKEFTHVSSSMVRELYSYGADVTKFMPPSIDLKEFL